MENKHLIRRSIISLIELLIESNSTVQIYDSNSILRTCSDAVTSKKYIGYYTYTQDERINDKKFENIETTFVIYKENKNRGTMSNIMQLTIPSSDEIETWEITDRYIKMNNIIIAYRYNDKKIL